jgi:tetratricopeptide (TPR) repeat protein
MRNVLRVLVVAIAAVACGWAILVWVVRPMQCNRVITDITRRTNSLDNIGNEYQRVARARTNLQTLRALQCDTDVRVPMLIGANEEALGQYDDAVTAYREALRADQRPEIYVAIGDALVQLGRVDEAVDNYVIAARFSPNVLENIMGEEIARRIRRRIGVQ